MLFSVQDPSSPRDQNPYQAPQAAAYPDYPPPAYGHARPNQDLELVVPVNVAPLALIAGYLGFASFLCLPAPLALLVGILALRDLATRPDKVGKGRAWFGIVTGAIGTLLLAIGVLENLLK
jgi:hypothetical protein